MWPHQKEFKAFVFFLQFRAWELPGQAFSAASGERGAGCRANLAAHHDLQGVGAKFTIIQDNDHPA